MVVFTKVLSLRVLTVLAAVGQFASVGGSSIQNAHDTPRVQENTTLSRQHPPGALPKPLYAIASKVSTLLSIKEAFMIGANALQIDVQPWGLDQWRTDYDGPDYIEGETLEAMVRKVHWQRWRRHKPDVGFVWFNIKGADYCDWRFPGCTFDALRDLARDWLHRRRVHVLYGFPDAESAAYKSIQSDLNEFEAVIVHGKASTLKDAFATHGPYNINKRAMSYGHHNLTVGFGNCTEESDYTCTELRQGVESKKDIGKVFGGTHTVGQGIYVEALLNAGIDGIVFGPTEGPFSEDLNTRAAFRDIQRWVDMHSHLRYLANFDDLPFDSDPWLDDRV